MTSSSTVRRPSPSRSMRSDVASEPASLNPAAGRASCAVPGWRRGTAPGSWRRSGRRPRLRPGVGTSRAERRGRPGRGRRSWSRRGLDDAASLRVVAGAIDDAVSVGVPFLLFTELAPGAARTNGTPAPATGQDCLSVCRGSGSSGPRTGRPGCATATGPSRRSGRPDGSAGVSHGRTARSYSSARSARSAAPSDFAQIWPATSRQAMALATIASAAGSVASSAPSRCRMFGTSCSCHWRCFSMLRALSDGVSYITLPPGAVSADFTATSNLAGQ